MPFKTVLSVVGVEQSDRDLQLAIELCREAQAHLSVLMVGLAAPPPVGEYAGMVSDAWMQERQQDVERLAGRTESVTALLAASGVSADVATEYSEIAWADDVVGRRARYADITVIGPELLEGETFKPKALAGALFSSGKPVLVIPEGARATFRPGKILVAWDSGREATRAVRESLEMLLGAREVHLVLVDPDDGDGGQGDEPGADAATYLARHGVKISVDRLPGSGHSVAHILRQRSVDFGADMMVMGAYGHSRLRERIFGGTTRSMLDRPPLPLLMAR